MRALIAAALLTALGLLTSPSAHAMQCVVFAREQSGIGLRGDAWTWWNGAAGQYDRGLAPRPGAVVVFKKHGAMRHGHVAVVAQVVTPRRLLVDHANWAPNRGHARGLVAKLVTVTDVSPHNDWSQVRVWNDASGELGTRTYPTYGFIYARGGSAGGDADDSLIADVAAQPGLASAGMAPSAIEAVSASPSALASLGDLLSPNSESAGLAVTAALAQ